MFSSKNEVRRLAGLKTFAETSPDNNWKNIPEKKQLVMEEKMFTTRSVKEICKYLAERTEDRAVAVNAVNEPELIKLDANKVQLIKEALTKLFAIKERNRLRAIAFLTPLNEEEMPEGMPAVSGETAPAEVPPTDASSSASTGSSVDPNISNLIKTLASSAEGKTGEELVDYLVKIYYAGFEDGKNSGDEEQMPADMPTDSSAQPPADVNNLSI